MFETEEMKKYVIVLVGFVLGGLLGYGYYFLFGCDSNSCSLSSNWQFTTLFGAIVGLVLSFPSKKKSLKGNIDNEYKQKYNN